MTINKLKSRVSFVLIISHFLVLMLILFFGLVDGSYGSEETKSAVVIVLPVFAIFTTAIIKFYAKRPYKGVDRSRQVSEIFVFISFFLPIVLNLFVITVLVNQAKYNKQTPEDFTFWLGMVETAIGVYIGLSIKELFEKE